MGDRKRRADSDAYYGRPPPPKYSRSSYHDDPEPRYTSHHHSYEGGSGARRSYDDYLRTYRTAEYHPASAPAAPVPDYHHYYSSRGAAGYYESSGATRSYHHPADYDRRNYDRSVDEFLRKTSDSSRERRARIERR